MLKKFGVQGVKVQEIVSLDDAILAFLPWVSYHFLLPHCESPKDLIWSNITASWPVYGLIFLFKWIEEDSEKQEQSCPEGVWFANQVSIFNSSLVMDSNWEQTINNACASVALLNIVNNVPCIDLGENLQGFKTFTANFTPALRGDAIGNFDFVKEVHNSFARYVKHQRTASYPGSLFYTSHPKSC